ncbi:MAG TPA: xanthine dehydrogenase family protein molybdopterin-binding subunit [Candidatus Binatia bacterium]|nr:xanthine dehydrogenase family protein molybdopterin-binding subunit [Candidatus Binatia bacterium]
MSLVGSNVEMVGGRAKVSGAVSYVANMEFPGQLYAKALRSPYPHAKLMRIDASKAAALPGVLAVVTRDDLTGLNPYFGTGVEDQPVLVIDKVRCVGDIVAAVAADTREIAEEAVTLIHVEYEELPAATDLLEAAKPGAPIIHEQHVDKRAGGNIHGVYRAASGDIERGFKESDEVIENVYKIPPVQHGHIEPHVVTALWEPGGKLVVHTPSQTPSPLQEQIAKIFKMPLNRVRVVVPFIGGGYGGKNHARIEPVVALLARKARRPVQWILNRDEVFLTGRRFGAVVKIKTGFKRDGRLWARKVDAWYDMGAYALSGPANTKNACIIAGGPYNIPHRDYTTYAVYTNLPPAGPYRGVGASHVCWAYESDIDDIARCCNLDPLEVRLKNLLQENDRFITGEPMISVGVAECVIRTARSINWQSGAEQSLRSDAIVRGKGLAVAIKSTSTPSTSAASVRLNADGSAILLTSTSDMGQGAQTSLAQIVADELALPFERVTVTFPDSDVTPYDKSTSSSRATFHMGKAAQIACGQIREQLFQAAAKTLEARVEDLELRDERLRVKGVPEKNLTYPQIFKAIYGEASGSLFGSYTLRTEGGVDAATGQGKGSSFWFYSAAGAEVEVDTETGKVRVLRVVSAVDVGKAVHPLQCSLQNEGSALAGLGSALFEEMCYDNGQPINSSFLDYLLPSMLDHPAEFQSELVETPHPDGPCGAKGMGEAALPPMAPAIGNAIANALSGVRIRDLPVKPHKIVTALETTKEKR